MVVAACLLVAIGVVTMTTARPAGAAGGELIDTVTLGGNGFDDGTGVAVDAAGNVITTGSFEGTVDFDPGSGVTERTSNGSTDVFVSKLSPTGELVWAVTFGSADSDRASDIVVDAAGNIITTGVFDGTVDFDPGPGVAERTSTGSGDVFVSRLSPTGDLVSAISFGSTSFDEGFGVAIDATGNVITTGSFQDTVDFDPGPGVTERTSNGSRDGFVSKYSPAGDLLWATSFGSTGSDRGFGVAVDGAGNVITTGPFEGTVDFDPGPGVTERTSNGFDDVFVSKLSATGDLLWAASFGSTGSDGGSGVAVDGAGSVVITGSFEGTVDFDPGPGITERTSNGSLDVFMSKLTPNGDLLWAAGFGGTNFDEGTRVAVEAAGSIAITGYFTGPADFDPGPGVTNLTSTVGDAFVARFSPTGDLAWAAGFGGPDFDGGFGVAVDGAGTVTTTGTFQGTTDFDPGPGTADRTSNGANDVFVVRLAAAGLCDGVAVTVDIAAGDTPTSGDDVVLGTPGDDVIAAGDGNDIICGNGGNDTIAGGTGDDTILTGTGNDTIFGGDDADSILDDGGTNTIQGNNGADSILTGDGDDTIAGNAGVDFIGSGAGNDLIYGGPGDDSIFTDSGANTILGGPGEDFILGGTDTDLISGNADDDEISAGNGNDTIYGVDGNDTLGGDDGDDTILGGVGDDTIGGGDGNDLISGNNDNDTIAGNADNDTIYGVDGNDTIAGNNGDDTILGGDGIDTIDGGNDNDLLSGNNGNDTVDGGPGTDEVYGANGNDTLTGGHGQDIILGGNNTDTIHADDGETDQVSGNAGTDTCARDPALDTAFSCETLLP